MTQLTQMAASLRLAIAAALAALLLCVAGGASAAPPGATTYNLPAALASSPFSCTLSSGINYNCPSISLSKDARLNLTGDVVLNIAGAFSASKSLETVDNGYALTISSSGSMALQKDVNLKATLKAGGSMSIAKDAIINGNITAGGSISIDKDGVINGNVTAGGALSVAKGTVINGTCFAAGGSNYVCAAPVSGLHHLRLKHDGSGVTCTGSLVIINACSGADSEGACSGSMTAVAGNIIATADGAQLASVPFSIPANSGATSVIVPVAKAGEAMFSFANVSVAPSSANTCWNSTTKIASCSHQYNPSGFLLGLSEHISEQQQTLTVSAVETDQKTLACTPAFSDVTRSVRFTCGYSNPTTGTLAVRLGDATLGNMVALNTANNASAACDGGGRAVNLDFNEDGVATTSLLYADSGSISLKASYAPANMEGDTNFVAVPARFSLSTASPPANSGLPFASGAPALTAGTAFGAKVTALNAAGNPTPNFGRESSPSRVLLGFNRCLPSSGADGAFTGSLLLSGFSAGAASSTTLAWSEVGSGELTAKLSDANSVALNYLDSALTVTGGTASGGVCAGNVGPFAPAYFETELTPAHLSTYSGQPITKVLVKPYNSAGVVTTNYYGAFAREVKLTALAAPGGIALPAGTGSLSLATIAATDFAASGSASGTATAEPVYTFTAPADPRSAKPAPLLILLRAVDANGVSSVGRAEAITQIRFGRLQLSNAFGSSKQDLSVPVRAEYWTGQAWLTNADDSSTFIPAASVALTRAPTVTGGSVSGSVTLDKGKGKLLLLKPSGKGYIDLAVNLGSSSTDVACVGAHAPSTGAALPWLRSLNGNCPATYDHDPAARASFGVFSPETNATIHVREAFD